MEVARRIQGYKAVLLQGHSATTTGGDLEEAVMNMLWLEEQARINYDALSALGSNYPSISDALIAEKKSRRRTARCIPNGA